MPVDSLEPTANTVYSTAERSLIEISELQSTLVTNLTEQNEHIEQLVQDSFSTTENVGRGNKELKRASERTSGARILFHSTCAFCAFLVVWDLIF
jgi:syntaxin 18